MNKVLSLEFDFANKLITPKENILENLALEKFSKIVIKFIRFLSKAFYYDVLNILNYFPNTPIHFIKPCLSFLTFLNSKNKAILKNVEKLHLSSNEFIKIPEETLFEIYFSKVRALLEILFYKRKFYVYYQTFQK
ncbi:hypothetical protein TUBRATIS_004500 [Tubulinosema ratisbonensis]|uniref:Uncharacterized protein n=1 Tax=Tubulinosema ratisbonensis TaxID=291195 RepID=A0A437APS5_9MICR|nr:hypothetical protein TUBRATIS_004500 [Tubulinosema ratisbonensis]